MKDPGSRPLPVGLKNTAKTAVVMREAVSKFPAKAWSKYDMNITYQLSANVTYGYIESVDALLRAAEQSNGYHERDTMLSAVALRCGIEGDPTDRRWLRSMFIMDLARKIPGVASYGECSRNRAWPKGHEKDKGYVTSKSKFCLAFENSVDEDYVTEKLYDCLRSGSVPIVSGSKTIRKFVPPGAAIFADDYDNIDDLAMAIQMVGREKATWDRMRRWIDQRDSSEWKEWEALMRSVEGAGVRCRLCELAGKGRKKVEVDEGKRRRRYAWEADRVRKEDEERRMALAEKQFVKVEL
mmetsp:Transcript_21445/g.53876  ORF Transcript_21445/g.53876 Transcript_21445/m.53876 type:complete len:296 (+) Transcript_21445:1-888(+)